MELCSIASGSSGNCIYIGTETTKILVDAGISGKRIVDGLASINVDISEIKGILITHEHSDHIQGVHVIAKKYNLDIYGTEKTLKFIYDNCKGNIGNSKMISIVPDVDFMIGDILVHPFAISHDALDPVSYRLESGNARFGVATDLGYFDDYIVENLSDLDGIYIESNHDENILMVGHYPYNLKVRIAGQKGHLSNDDAAELLGRITTCRLKFVLLAHLSKENNYAELAFETAKAKLSSLGCCNSEIKLTVANRDIPSDIYIV